MLKALALEGQHELCCLLISKAEKRANKKFACATSSVARNILSKIEIKFWKVLEPYGDRLTPDFTSILDMNQENRRTLY